MFNILIVEDELIAAEYLKEILTTNGFNVVGVIDKGRVATVEIPKIKPDMVLMDIMLKDGISGSEVALHLKQHSPDIAIIFLTAYDDREIVESAIESNSYGYLMKPYNEREIVNTLKIVLARIKKERFGVKQSPLGLVKIDDNLVFDRNLKRLFRDDREVKLGKNALNFLELLCKQPNITVSNEQISLSIWGEVRKAVTLRSQIYRIRVQIGKDIIHNVNGLGYMVKTI